MLTVGRDGEVRADDKVLAVGKTEVEVTGDEWLNDKVNEVETRCTRTRRAGPGRLGKGEKRNSRRTDQIKEMLPHSALTD